MIISICIERHGTVNTVKEELLRISSYGPVANGSHVKRPFMDYSAALVASGYRKTSYKGSKTHSEIMPEISIERNLPGPEGSKYFFMGVMSDLPTSKNDPVYGLGFYGKAVVDEHEFNLGDFAFSFSVGLEQLLHNEHGRTGTFLMLGFAIAYKIQMMAIEIDVKDFKRSEKKFNPEAEYFKIDAGVRYYF
jgi:hypothetical protein